MEWRSDGSGGSCSAGGSDPPLGRVGDAGLLGLVNT